MKAFINGKIITMEGQTFERGFLLVDDKGKIDSLGQMDDYQPDKSWQIIDLEGKYLLPGFVDAHTHLGIYEEIYAHEGDDVNEMSEPVTPHLRAVDGLNIHDLGFQDALKGGVTTVMVSPGSANVIGGTVCILKTAGKNLEKRMINESAGLKIAFGENPKDTYGPEKKMPYTRMGIAALLRESLVEGENYLKSEDADRDLAKEEIVKVLQGKVPLRAHAHRADDILTAIKISEEFKLKLTIEHATEAHLILDELKGKDVPLCLGPLFISRAKVELKEKSFKNPAILQEAGHKVAFITDHPETPIDYAVLNAILAVREGMDPYEALKALTINPAEILGVGRRCGSLAVGKDADLVVWSGHPLDIMKRVEAVWIDGQLLYEGDK